MKNHYKTKPKAILCLLLLFVFFLGTSTPVSAKTEFATANTLGTLSLTITGDLRICSGGSTTLSADLRDCTGTPTFTWKRFDNYYGNTQTINVNSPGIYTVTVNCNGVTTTASVEVKQFTIASFVQNACSGGLGSINLVANNAMGQPTYLWSNGATTEDLTNVPSGLYTVTATDVDGCTATTSALISSPNVNISAGNDVSICAGNSTVLQGSGADNYSWAPAASLSSNQGANPTATPAVTTTYTLTAYVNTGNLVNNGDFNNRNTGFNTDYAYVNSFFVGNYSSGTGLYPEGKYAVVPNRTDTNLTKYHPNFRGIGHNNGSPVNVNDDYYMAINGSATAGQAVWSQTVQVIPNTNYNFSTWIATINASNVSRLRF